MNFIKLGWVKAKKIEDLKGITVGALKKKRERGVLVEGVHWRKAPDNVIYFNYERLDEFLEHGYE
ncbi:MAG: hypothetical protein HRU23_08140 [Gammaproteobacteria bacterium]|nr:hypothetical protein [Gammaproteobacteria bacterium]